MKKIKVAVLLHGLGANGIDSLFANLAEQWNQCLFDITYFIAVDENATQFWEKRVVQSGINVVKLHDLDKGRLKKFPKTLYKALKQYGPFDVIHVNMDMLSGVCAFVAKLAGVKKRIVHAHRGNSVMPRHFCQRILKECYLFLMTKMIRFFSTDRVGCSDVAGDYFFGKNQYHLIYNGININDYFAEKEYEARKSRFITVGRMTLQKNPLKIVEIFYELHKQMPEASLTWLGDGPMRKDVEELVKKLELNDSVHLLGNRSDVSVFLKTADYYLFPSFFEGLSLALAEAQAAGLVCFVSDTCSQLSNCGLCKYIYLRNTSEEWAKQILEFIESKEKLLLDRSLLERFSIESTARSLEEIYSN